MFFPNGTLFIYRIFHYNLLQIICFWEEYVLGFVKVAEASEIPSGKVKKVELEGKEILIANVDGKYYAIGNKCTHMGGDLSKGSLSGNIVTCPRHKATFDVTSGKVVSGPKFPLSPKIKDEKSYKVKVEGNDILVSTD
ncbi:MAG: non-heme iron oxygenase ferredoxin subunit [Candidatus Freyarchaeota archaeon]|nr:non-heme iron oxygenase ferredoxin subunit [Candidatus Jordarchaeia archaeon]